VMSRKSKNRERRKQKQLARGSKGKGDHPLDGTSTFEGVSRASPRYNLRRGAQCVQNIK
jgi:hypothetical protein